MDKLKSANCGETVAPSNKECNAESFEPITNKNACGGTVLNSTAQCDLFSTKKLEEQVSSQIGEMTKPELTKHLNNKRELLDKSGKRIGEIDQTLEYIRKNREKYLRKPKLLEANNGENKKESCAGAGLQM